MSWGAAFASESEASARGPLAANPATFGEIWGAAWSASGLDTVTGVTAPLREAYGDLSAAVEGASGKTIADFTASRPDFGLATSDMTSTIGNQVKVLGELIADLDPAAQEKIKPLLDVNARARAKSAATERSAADVASRTYGLSGHAVSFLSGMARQMVDPINLATAPVGGPLKGPVLKMLGREAAIGAVTQAVQEPFVQEGRASLGLESGVGEALGNIGEAAFGNAAFSGLMRGGGYLLRRAYEASPFGQRATDAQPVAQPDPGGPGDVLTPARPVDDTPGQRAPDVMVDDVDAKLREAAASPAMRELTPDDFDAAARWAERTDMIEELAPVQSTAGRAAHADIVNAFMEKFNRGEKFDGKADEIIAAFEAQQAARRTDLTGSNAQQDSGSNPAARTGEPTAMATPAVQPAARPDAGAPASDATPAPAQVLPAPEAAPKAKPARKARRSQAGEPVSMVRFIAMNGGIKLDADAIAQGWHTIFVPGAGALARRNGLRVDEHWRESLMEAGYLRWDEPDALARDIRTELIDYIHDEAHFKRKHYSAHDQDELAKFQDAQIEDANASYYQMVDLEVAGIRDDLRSVGIDPDGVDPDLLREAAELMSLGRETDNLVAFERAVMSRELAEPNTVDSVRAEADNFPGWEDFDETFSRYAPEDRGATGRDGAPERDAGNRGGPAPAGNQLQGARSAGTQASELPDLSGRAPDLVDPAAARARLADLARALDEAGGDIPVYPDGYDGGVSARQLLDDIRDDADAADALNACLGQGGGS